MVKRAGSARKKALGRGESPKTGLARALSKLGHCSRSAAVKLITDGRVRLNGSTIRDPETPVRLSAARIEVDGKSVVAASKTYLMMNKPRGLLTTVSDEKGRDTVYSLLPGEGLWLAPVGRLDKASEGLLLLTNDTEWAARVTTPESHLTKTYHVQVAAQLGDQHISRLREGVREGGELLRAKRACVLRQGGKNCWIEIVLDEGKNRQIRRMFSALSIEVLRLIRVAIGDLQLGNLPKGNVRQLTAGEVRVLVRHS